MSDDATPRLSLPYLAAAQAQKHVTLNEGLSMLDGLVQTAVESRTTAAQPGSPADGVLYILPASATGTDWAGKPAGTVMRFEAGAWAELEVAEGHIAYVADEGVLIFFDGAAWADFSGLIDTLQGLSLLGVNATADATNKLSVSSAAVLFNHAGAGSQVKVNKAGASDTGSHLFQTAFSGRAEFGLIGGDDFKLKVSPNGSAWTDVMSVDKTTGQATFTLSTLRQLQVDVFTAGGTYNVPAWARRLRVVCIGAGGGGGSGAAGTNAANRGGGAGGGAGGRSEEEYDVSELAASLSVTVGAAGSAGTSVTGTNNGVAGGSGGDSFVSSSGAVILRGFGAAGGAAGATSGASAGAGGTGVVRSNDGGGGSASGNGSGGQDRTYGAAPGGGGGGGGVSTAGAAGDGGAGGYGYWIGSTGRRASPGSGGSSGGAGAAASDKAWTRGCGGGGGGGAGNAAANGGAGGAGGIPGGGGGGGGGTRDTFNSGAGGAGGRGEVWILAIG
jgi:hypothetical protein